MKTFVFFINSGKKKNCIFLLISPPTESSTVVSGVEGRTRGKVERGGCTCVGLTFLDPRTADADRKGREEDHQLDPVAIRVPLL